MLLILAILLAIAIPTFLGVTKSANDRAAQSNLNTALLNAKAQYQQNSQSYPASANLLTALSSAEPSLSFQTGASTNQNQISVFVSADFAALVMATYSAQTHNCWIVVDTPTATSTRCRYAVRWHHPDTDCGCRHDPRTGGCNQRPLPLRTTNSGLHTPRSSQPVRSKSPPAIVKRVRCRHNINTNYRYSYTAFPAI